MKRSVFLFFLTSVCIICHYGHAQLLTAPPPVPKEHPRVLIRPNDIQELQKKKELPEFQKYWSQIKNNGQPICEALTYLVEGDKSKGISAIEGAYQALTKTTSNGLRLMNEVFLGACVYDWCYPLMTSSQRQKFIKEFARIHNLHPPYWPAVEGHGTIVSHNTSGWFFNQLPAGLAIYDEDPRIWNQASTIFFKEFQEVRNFAIKSQMSHQGWYVSTRWSHMMLAAFLFNKISDGKDVWIDDFEQVGYMLAYFMRTDGQIMRLGDTNSDSWAYEFHNIFLDGLANYYKNPQLASLAEHPLFQSYNSVRDDLFGKFLLRPEGIGRESLATLPKTKYFDEPIGGEMVARTGWSVADRNSKEAVVDMRIGQYYFGGHQHKDFGTFQIYYKGNLTGDGGMYGGSKSKFSSGYWKNYYRSTTAHNGLLIKDPNEKYFGESWTNTKVDGGMRWPLNNDVQPNDMNALLNPKNGYQYAEVIAHEFGNDSQNPEYSYISGDLTKGYIYSNKANADKVSKVTRSMVTYNTGDEKYPAVFVVFDRIVATDPSFKKVFLLNSMSNPSITGNQTTLNAKDGYAGKLVSYTILPEKPSIKVAPGHSINGTTYNPGTKSDPSYEDMKFRVEVSPSQSNKEDFFLHSMIVMDKGVNPPPATQINADQLIGVKTLDHVTLFNKNTTLLSDASFFIEDQNHKVMKVLLTDVLPGEWMIEREGSVVANITATEQGKSIYFETSPGLIRVRQISSFSTVSEGK
ncbi:MAG: heparinase II/III family protein [Cyclobacteriaceae bacterium]